MNKGLNQRNVISFLLASAVGISSAIANPTDAQLPTYKELPRLSVLVSAFKPFLKSETNMAQMVSDAVSDLARQDARFRNISLDRIDLDVVYGQSAEALIERAKSGETPDLIIGIGQSALTKQVLIETGADKYSSNILDMRGRKRSETDFPSLPVEIGFNFPVHDMYCSLPKNERKKVGISFSGGSFVCNDLGYYMANFVRPKGEINQVFDVRLRQLQSRYESELKSIQAEMDSLIKSNAEENKKIMLEEAPARAAFEKELALFRATNPVKTNSSNQADQLVGPLVTDFKNEPSQQEPVFKTRVKDLKSFYQNQAASKKRSLTAEFDLEKRRIQKLNELLGVEKNVKFVFIHVPASDGVAYQPKYNLLNAVCIPASQPLGQGDWYPENMSMAKMDSSLNSLRSKARNFVNRNLKDPQAGYRTLPADECEKSPGTIQQAYKDKQGVTQYRQVPAPPKGKYIYQLQAYTQKAQIKELTEAQVYAKTILEMLYGSVSKASFKQTPLLPLPSFQKSSAQFYPRSNDDLKMTIDWLKNLTTGFTRTKAAASPGVAPQTEYIPPQLNAFDSECYQEVVKKMLDARKSDLSKKQGMY